MTPPRTILDLVGRLDEAERSRVPIRQLSLQHPDMTVEDAYAVQKSWVESTDYGPLSSVTCRFVGADTGD